MSTTFNSLTPSLVTLSSDFRVQSQGVGTMEAMVYSIAPNTRVIHLMHGIPGFDLIAAARTMETLYYFPTGTHVCVCDPGVGTKRRAIIIKTGRGDYLVGPDNGLFIPATRLLGGISSVHEITSRKYMREPVSHIFHGRDIFAPAAAHLSIGVSIDKFGPEIDPAELTPAPYMEAKILESSIEATIIQINGFGSLHLNIQHAGWDSLNIALGAKVKLQIPKTDSHPAQEIVVRHCQTFGEVAEGENLIMKDDYGRVEIAKNLGSINSELGLNIGDEIKVVI